MDELSAVHNAAERALAYAATVDERRVFPDAAAVDALSALGGTLPDGESDVAETLELLAEVGGAATVVNTGPNYYGFVTGATHPAALGAAMIADAWDQNAALPVMSPVAAALHDITREWLVDLLGLGADTDVAYVTGATVANASVSLPRGTRSSPRWGGTLRPRDCSGPRRSRW